MIYWMRVHKEIKKAQMLKEMMVEYGISMEKEIIREGFVTVELSELFYSKH